MRVFFLFLLAFSFAPSSEAKEKALPYLGPGAEKLSKAEYERVYKNYIQTSVLLGYPFLEGPATPCEQALSSIFRQAGLFSYPVPAEAPQVRKSTASIRGKKVETFELGGTALQLLRGANGAPERLVWINSSSPKASRRLVQSMQKDVLTLERDPVTGLERVKGIPVGFPHPQLNASGQGLYVKILKFNGKKEGCEPLEFADNSWTNGFDLSDARCSGLQQDAERAWADKITPDTFASRELARMKEAARKSALAHGVSEAEAKRLVEQYFVPPFTNPINVVGGAMRNLAQCNLLALGRTGQEKAPAAPAVDGKSLDAAGSGQ